MAQRRKISLVLADVDGTLVNEQKVLTERAQKRCQSLAHRRRPLRYHQRPAAARHGHAVRCRSIWIRRSRPSTAGSSLSRISQSSGRRRCRPTSRGEAIDLIRKRGLDAWVYSGNDWLITKPDAPHVAREAWTVKFEPKVVADVAEHLDQTSPRSSASATTCDKVQRCEADAQAAFGERATATRSQPYYLDVTNKDANKGAVVAYLSRIWASRPRRSPPSAISPTTC